MSNRLISAQMQYDPTGITERLLAGKLINHTKKYYYIKSVEVVKSETCNTPGWMLLTLKFKGKLKRLGKAQKA